MIHPRRLSFTLLSFLLALLLGLVLLELGTKALLSRVASFRTYPAFYAAAGQARQPEILAVSYPVIDSLLGRSNEKTFENYGEEPPPSVEWKRRGPIIVALGGSTTDPNTERENWAKKLYELCGRGCLVKNGGVSGYTSTQELLKLERDVVPLRPQVVVSLNGINDESMQYFDEVTFTTPYQREVTKFLAGALRNTSSPLYNPPTLTGFLPNSRFLLRLLGHALFAAKTETTVHLGTHDNFSRAGRWEHNVRMMHAVAAEFGIQYFVFLQPSLGLFPDVLRAKKAQLGIDGFFDEKRVKEFYIEARAACAKLPYCLDLSRDFPQRADLYWDVMHLLPPGHQLEAERIFAFLKAKKAL